MTKLHLVPDSGRQEAAPIPALWDGATRIIQDPDCGVLIDEPSARYYCRHVCLALDNADEQSAARTAVQVCLHMYCTALNRAARPGQRVPRARSAESRFWHRLLREYALGKNGTLDTLLGGCRTLAADLFGTDPERACAQEVREDSPPRAPAPI